MQRMWFPNDEAWYKVKKARDNPLGEETFEKRESINSATSKHFPFGTMSKM